MSSLLVNVFFEALKSARRFCASSFSSSKSVSNASRGLATNSVVVFVFLDPTRPFAVSVAGQYRRRFLGGVRTPTIRVLRDRGFRV